MSFLWAAQHTTAHERVQFLERAQYFFDYSVNTLAARPTRHYTRPVVLLLTNGIRYAWYGVNASALPEPAAVKPPAASPPPAPFETQKIRAKRHAVIVTILSLVAADDGRRVLDPLIDAPSARQV